jgi:hypothetical protein
MEVGGKAGDQPDLKKLSYQKGQAARKGIVSTKNKSSLDKNVEDRLKQMTRSAMTPAGDGLVQASSSHDVLTAARTVLTR